MIGDLKTMPLSEMLQWLSQGKRTGALKVRNSYITKKIFFREGSVISASSSDPRDYLGQFLLSRNWISEMQLIKAIELQEKKKMLLGKILVETKILSENQVVEAVELKTLETIFSLFLWQEGKFEFVAEELQLYQLIPISSKVDELIHEGMNRKGEWHKFLQIFSSTSAVVDKAGNKPLPAVLEKTVVLKNLWKLMNGLLSLEEIALYLHCSDFEICAAAYKLYEVDLITIVKVKEKKEDAPDLPSEMFVTLGQKKMKEGKYEEAINLLNYLMIKTPNVDSNVIGLKDFAEKKFVKQMKETILKPDAAPFLRIPIDEVSGLNITPEESFLITRINGSWTIKDILCVVPFEEFKAIRYMRNLLVRDIIELK